jgi:hypothetical protein
MRCLDGCLLDVGDSAFQLVGALGADGNESSGAQDAVARGEVGFLMENVVVPATPTSPTGVYPLEVLI